MKNNFLNTIVMLLFAINAQAAEKGHASKTLSTFSASAPGIGSLRVEVKDLGEPVYRPLQLTISVSCKNKASGTKKVVPEILKQESICDYRDAQYDERSKTLTIHYSTSEFSLEQAKCDGHWSQAFDLRELCSPSAQ